MYLKPHDESRIEELHISRQIRTQFISHKPNRHERIFMSRGPFRIKDLQQKLHNTVGVGIDLS